MIVAFRGSNTCFGFGLIYDTVFPAFFLMKLMCFAKQTAEMVIQEIKLCAGNNDGKTSRTWPSCCLAFLTISLSFTWLIHCSNSYAPANRQPMLYTP